MVNVVHRTSAFPLAALDRDGVLTVLPAASHVDGLLEPVDVDLGEYQGFEAGALGGSAQRAGSDAPEPGGERDDGSGPAEKQRRVEGVKLNCGALLVGLDNSQVEAV